ncbi:casparian strip membrane protein 1-like [Chenopodium quinoa]|uniref:CASP-like protein n=1 Tax=Chenopodium quinoa TaxID=63459 RepID=A0A803MNG1_CHEQI|nr:casparian strip membrane protein 1-like [Chenopodium quinoa]
MSKGGLEAGETSKGAASASRGLSIPDFLFRVVAGLATLASAIAMGTTNETLPFFTQFIRFRAEYDDLPTFTFFVVANAIITGYLVLSLTLSIFHIIRSGAKVTRIVLAILDMLALGLLTSAASAATAIVYLAHKGNASANWFAICQQFNNFCERTSGSLIGSYVAIVMFVLLILLSAFAISRHH